VYFKKKANELIRNSNGSFRVHQILSTVIWYSYDEPIAFKNFGKKVVTTDYNFGVTTQKHKSMISWLTNSVSKVFLGDTRRESQVWVDCRVFYDLKYYSLQLQDSRRVVDKDELVKVTRGIMEELHEKIMSKKRKSRALDELKADYETYHHLLLTNFEEVI